MRFPIFGATDDNPDTAGTTAYTHINNRFQDNWNATENTRQVPISEDLTVVGLRVVLTTAPGSGKSRAFTLRKNAADTGCTVTISDNSVTATFTGSVALTAGDLLSLQEVATGSPTAPGTVYWHFTVDTVGGVYLLLGAGTNTAPTGAANYMTPFGGQAWNTTVTNMDVPVPSGYTATKLTAASTDGSPGAGKSYAVSLRINGSSDALTATISDTNQSASATGSQALVAGDNIAVKETPSGTPTAVRLAWCVSLTPGTASEAFYGYGTNAALGVGGTNYEQPIGSGNNSWNATETTRQLRLPACDVKKLQVRLSVAPGVTQSRTFTARKNAAATALTAAVTDTATTASDTSHTVAFAADDLLSMEQASSAAPAASAAHFSYVLVMAQPSRLSRLAAMGVG